MSNISLCLVQDKPLLRESLKAIGPRTRLALKVSLNTKRTSHWYYFAYVHVVTRLVISQSSIQIVFLDCLHSDLAPTFDWVSTDYWQLWTRMISQQSIDSWPTDYQQAEVWANVHSQRSHFHGLWRQLWLASIIILRTEFRAVGNLQPIDFQV